jgi:hypothetical protein
MTARPRRRPLRLRTVQEDRREEIVVELVALIKRVEAGEFRSLVLFAEGVPNTNDYVRWVGGPSRFHHVIGGLEVMKTHVLDQQRGR